ncbi:MAG: PQQ-dependent dehydrogenase, methanol/ethanol family [Gammaproteobacteria bacterium]
MGTTTAFGAADVDTARMRAVNREPENWMSWGRTYDEQRFSPLKQINDRNVGKLGLAWYAELDTFRGVEATPLVIDGVLYNTSAWNITTAYDAKTGRVLWTHDPQVPRSIGRLACCDIVSRGLAAWKGKLIIATLDGRLIALNASTGEQIWSVQTLDVPGDWPYTVTGAPRVFDGKVLIGNSGAELGVRGYVTAYDVETGHKLWRFFTVPGDPAKGFENAAMERAAKTWTGEWWKAGGGGTAWDSIVYDPKLKLVYIGVGNGSPWAQKFRSPGGGDNLFLASIVAVKADTGEYVWHYQESPGEQWDNTATQHIILADLKIRGRVRQVLMQAPKNGFFYVLDRRTGELLSADAFIPTTWASHVDLKTGRPVELPDARYGDTPVLLAPHPGGGHNFNPMSYSPRTGLVYFPVVQSFGTFASASSYAPGGGTGVTYEGHSDVRKRFADYGAANSHSWLVAWNPVARKEAWRIGRPRSGSGGVLTTAGNLLVQGTIDRNIAIHRADNGEMLWEMPVQTVPIAGPISYAVDGEQYIAVNADWGGGLAHVEMASGKGLHVSSARLLVFALGGSAHLPPLPDAPPLSPPPRVKTTDAVLHRGEQLYGQHCVMCHGTQVRGGLKDLRHMTPETRATFYDIVLGGLRKDKGMVSFADKLDRRDAEAINAYVTIRALEDWGEEPSAPRNP